MSRATFTEIQSPYVMGSVVNYQCEDVERYQFKNNSASVCTEENGHLKWTDDVMCIPGIISWQIMVTGTDAGGSEHLLRKKYSSALLSPFLLL